ncbi:MAG TPA: DUF4011 domain-containing protein, partial [Opitutaceae bacterium]|nr:DUF4011 domain-containing protein [Opitutaceae bacterium]
MTIPAEESPFFRLLRQGVQSGGFETDDAIGILLPLFRQVVSAHERGLVAPLRGTDAFQLNEEGKFIFDEAQLAPPERNLAKVEQMVRSRSHAVQIVGESSQTTDLAEGQHSVSRSDIGNPEEVPTKPVFLPGYQGWEHAVGHHDPVTDIFSLGLLLASFACGLDFTDRNDLELFVGHRDNLFAVNARLHPVLANVIVQMTELDRHRRAQDLGQLVRWLENYRDQPVDLDLSQIQAGGSVDRRKLIHTHLRDRLFEISRRNRLIYFKSNLQTLNLTIASVPLVMDVRNIRLEQLFVWHPQLASAISSGESLALGKYLRLEDAPYIPGVLDKIIAEARRDRAEYGFAQLRLVLCFLRWHNLKDTPQERIHSPLLLLPVELSKRKGVRDQYVLAPTSTEAEVNPALRHHLKTLYGINLPESIDLQETSLDSLYDTLQTQIRSSEPSVTLEKVDRPKIELIHARARQRLDQWKQRQRLRPAPKASASVEYSYDRENYRPRGLQLFLHKIRPAPFPLA